MVDDKRLRLRCELGDLEIKDVVKSSGSTLVSKHFVQTSADRIEEWCYGTYVSTGRSRQWREYHSHAISSQHRAPSLTVLGEMKGKRRRTREHENPG